MTEKNIKKTLSMSPQTMKLLEDYAQKRGLSISAAIRVIVADMEELFPDRFVSEKKGQE